MEWKSEHLPIGKLKPLNNNPRTIRKEDFQKLERDHANGIFKPIVLNADYTILAGNQRYQYYLQTGIETVWCSVPSEQLTEAQAKEIIMLDNTHRGEFDMDILANEFEETIKELDLNLNIPLFPAVDYSDKNNEVDYASLVEPRHIKFTINDDDQYFRLLEILASLCSKYEMTNEQVLIKLLTDADKS